MPTLLIRYREGQESQRQIDQGDRVTVGRKMDNDLILKDPHVSRRHFVIESKNKRWELVNLSSTHGTIVNNKIVNRQILRNGDQIQAGSTKIIFSSDEPTPSETVSLANIGERLKENKTIQLSDSVFIEKDQSENSSTLATSDPKKVESFAFETIMATDHSSELRRRYMLLQDISKQMIAQFDLDKLLNFLLDKTFEVFQADNALVLLIDTKTKILVPKAVRLNGERATNLHISQVFIEQVFEKKIGILSTDARTDERFKAHESIISHGIRSVMCVPLLFHDEVLGMIHIDSETKEKAFNHEDLDLLTILGNQAALFVHNANLHEKMVGQETKLANLERYFSPQVAQRILSDEINIEPGGKKVDVTILYCDIRGFTALTELVGAEEIMGFLNLYFSEMSDIVFEFGGTLDKFIGDALLAVFGSPIPDSDSEMHGARAAEKMIKRMQEIHFSVGKVSIGIGLHQGNVIHGDLGSQKVMQYTVIGDVVNTTSRLAAKAKPNQIILSADIKKILGKRVEANSLGIFDIRGKQDSMEMFELKHCK